VPPTGLKRFWPTVTVQPDGEVDVAYLEGQEVQQNPDPSVVECKVAIGGGKFRSGPAVSLIDTFLIQSRDGGTTFGPPLRISSETSDWCNANYLFGGSLLSNLGDYFDVKANRNRIFTAWPDARNGFADVFFFFAAARGGEEDGGDRGSHRR
jgi:hypothetical protein